MNCKNCGFQIPPPIEGGICLFCAEILRDEREEEIKKNKERKNGLIKGLKGESQ